MQFYICSDLVLLQIRRHTAEELELMIETMVRLDQTDRSATNTVVGMVLIDILYFRMDDHELVRNGFIEGWIRPYVNRWSLGEQWITFHKNSDSLVHIMHSLE